MDADCASSVVALLRAAPDLLRALLAAAGLTLPDSSTLDSLWQQLAGAGFASVLPVLLAIALGAQLALLLCPPAKRDVYVLDFAVHKPCSRWVPAEAASGSSRALQQAPARPAHGQRDRPKRFPTAIRPFWSSRMARAAAALCPQPGASHPPARA